MNLAEVITAIRSEVNDPNAKYWSDIQITRWINHWTRAVSRQRAQADPSYGSHRLSISGADASRVRKIHDKVWAYHLPSWVHKVRMVRISKSSGDPAGGVIAPILHMRAGSGWRFEGSRRLDLVGFDNEDIDIYVAKVPALAHVGTVRKASATAGELYVDNQLSYPEEREAGAYIGAQFELTGVATALRDPRGTVAEVISADTEWDAGLASWLVKVTVMPHFPEVPAVNDTYTMHPELGDEHVMYLVLLVSRSLLQEHNNTERLKQIEPVLQQQRVDFLDGIRPRQDMQPPLIGEPYGAGGGWDLDRDWTSGVYL